MAERTSNSWMPRQGKHSVAIGPSLQRTLKARKNEPPPNAKHERHYYAFRYQFIPESVDQAKPGTAQVRKSEEHKRVDLQRGSINGDDEVHLFHGTEAPAKEWDCVLIYDEDSKMFTLEKLDSAVRFVYDKKQSRTQLQAASPVPPSIPSTSASSPDGTPLAQSVPRKTKPRTAAEQLEAEFEGELLQKPPRPSLPKAAAPEPARKPPQKKDPRELMFRKKEKPPKAPALLPPKEEEESEGEIVEHPRGSAFSRPAAALASSTASPAPPAAQTKKKSVAEAIVALRAAKTPASTSKPPTPPTHPLPAKPTSTASSQKPPTPAAPPVIVPPVVPPKVTQKAIKPVPTKKRERLEESAARPSPPKRTRPSPPPLTRPQPPASKKKEVELAFPGSSGVALPSSSSTLPSKLPSKPPSKPPSSKPSSLAFPGSSDVSPSLPSAPPAPAPAADDSDEEEWDPVLTTAQATTTAPAPAPAPPSMVPRTIMMEEIVPEPTVRREEPDEEEEEIDEDMFAKELDQHLGDDDQPAGEDEEDDFLAATLSPVVESQPMPGEERRPMSMNAFASGLGEGDDDNMWGDDDDTSSSDDSDDD